MRDPVVLLAGGRASRMKIPKGLVPVEGKPLLLWQWERLREAGVHDIILVLGFAAQMYETFLPRLNGLGIRYQVVRNYFPERGPFSSIQAGLSLCFGAAFILPIDVPCPAREIWERMERTTEGKKAVIPFFDNHGGHPVWLSPDFVNEIKTRAPTERLDEIIRQLPMKEKQRLDVDDARVLTNWNTPADLTPRSRRSR